MLRGDVHRFYLRLRKRWPNPPESVPELDHVRQIAAYYATLNSTERQLLIAWAKKEESGTGLIPLALSGVPMITLLFSPLFQAYIRTMPPWGWMVTWGTVVLGVTLGLYIHQRQRAFTTLHVHLLEQLERASEPTPFAGPDMH